MDNLGGVVSSLDVTFLETTPTGGEDHAFDHGDNILIFF